MILLLVFLLTLFAYSLFSKRLSGSFLTAPMMFVSVGLVYAFFLDEPISTEHQVSPFLQIAEIALVLLLFSDASKVDLGLLKKERSLPVRLLGPGMLLTIALGTVGAKLILPALDWWEAALIGTILAPTDASLGQVIVRSDKVPARLREALDVEAGLNDGLSVPFLLFFIAVATVADAAGSPSLFALVGEEIGYGVLLGGGIGWLGGKLLNAATHWQSMDQIHRPLAVVVLPVLAYLGSDHFGGSPFIAAYVAGLAAQKAFPDIRKGSVLFTDEWGESLSLGVFFLFGIVAGSPGAGLSGSVLIYGLLSLTVIRMVPVTLALSGTGLDFRQKAFVGWFGPRGLASIVLGLVYLEAETQLPGESTIMAAVIGAVLLSVFLHGLTARPGAKWISRE